MQKKEHISPARLAAYQDGELGRAEAGEIERHVAACGLCRARLESMDAVDRFVSIAPQPSPQRELWFGIEDAIETRRRPPEKTPMLLRSPMRRWAVAAVLAVALIGGGALVGVLGNVFSTEVQLADAFGFDYGAFLTGLNEPAKMERFDRAYGRRELPLEEALSAASAPIDRELIEQIPDGLDLGAVYVLSSKNAKALQVSYSHAGSEISVFKQPEGLPIRFAGYRIEPVAIGSKTCLMVDSGRYCAITFSTERGQYVVIGRNDDMHVARVIDGLMASL